MSNGSTRLSDVIGLSKHGRELDFVDIDLVRDTHLYVDPMLLYRSTLEEFNEAHTLIVEFFKRAIQFVKDSNTYKAELICRFPDAENLLGLAYKKAGHGPHHRLGRRIYEELVSNPDIQQRGLAFLNEFQLVIPGIAYDLISDAAVQICKDVFVDYTQEQCKIYNIELHEISVGHFYDWDNDEWESKVVKLPINPLRRGRPFLLTPWTVVRRYPEGDYQQFYDEIYRHVLWAKEEALWEALGKEPKFSWKDIAKKYKNEASKEGISRYVKSNPREIDKFLLKIRPTNETAWLEELSLATGISPNQIITEDTLAVLKVALTTAKDKQLLKQVHGPIAHQLGLKEPRKKIIPEIEMVTQRCKEDVILLLGNYNEGMTRLEEIRLNLSKDYHPIMVKDVKDSAAESLARKVLRLAALAKFVVIEDSYPAGQLYETSMLESTGVIVVILREKGKHSSFMSKGVSENFNNINEVDYELIAGNGIDERFIKEAKEWAENRYAEQIKFYDELYSSWRRPNAS